MEVMQYLRIIQEFSFQIATAIFEYELEEITDYTAIFLLDSALGGGMKGGKAGAITKDRRKRQAGAITRGR